MSNPLSVRRVKVQTIDATGNPDGPPTFGVMAADSYEQDYNDTFANLNELNNAIEDEGCILDVLETSHELWPTADRQKIGTDNFYGKDWEREDT